jgi:hypothetical protein
MNVLLVSLRIASNSFAWNAETLRSLIDLLCHPLSPCSMPPYSPPYLSFYMGLVEAFISQLKPE